MTRISFDLSPEKHQAFKSYCVENGSTITKEITAFVDSVLETAREEKAETTSQSEADPEKNPQENNDKPEKMPQTVTLNGETYELPENVINDLDKPLSAEERLKTLEQGFQDATKALDEIVTWKNKMRSWFDSSFAEVNKALKQIEEKFVEANQKFVITGKLIESAMNAIEETTSATKCEDDLKGLAVLKGETIH